MFFKAYHIVFSRHSAATKIVPLVSHGKGKHFESCHRKLRCNLHDMQGYGHQEFSFGKPWVAKHDG